MAHDVHSIIELQKTASLFDALGHSTRLKYCCLAYSLHHVALGASSGGVYCFRYEDLSYLRVIANKEGGVSLLRFSPDGTVLAVVCGGGHVIFWQLNLEEEQVSKRIHASTLLKGCIIKDAVWDDKGFRFFYGDEHGRVAVANVPRLSRMLGNKNIFKIPDGVIYEAKCPIVQLGYRQDSLLVSSTKKCVIIRPGVVGVIQVGTKQRDGNYGACFYSNPETSDVVVYSARPGCRLWEALPSGKVVKTHKFKDPIQEAPPTPILGIGKNPQFSLATDHMVSNIQMLMVHGVRFLVTWQSSSLLVLDAIKGHLVLWTDQLNNIVDIAIGNPDSILVLYDNSNKIAKLSIKPLHLSIQELLGMKDWIQSSKVGAHYISHWKELCKSTRNYYLVGVLQQIIDNCVGGADEDLELLRACVAKLTPEVSLLQQQSEEEDDEEEEKVVELPSSLQEHQKQNEWEGLWMPGNEQQQSSDNTQQLLDHVSNDYVITRDDDEPAVLLPTDTVDHMAADVSIVTKSSGAILIESPLLPEASHDLQEVPLSSYESSEKSHNQIDGSHEPSEGSHEFVKRVNESLEVLNKPADKSHELTQGSHELTQGSHELTQGSHELTQGSHELTQGSHESIDGSHDPLHGPSEGSHEHMERINGPLVLNDLKSHEVTKVPHNSVGLSDYPLDGSHAPVQQSDKLFDGSYDHLTLQEQVTEIHLESHDFFSGSHDLTEPLFDDEETSGTYRHRSLTAASVSSAPCISLASSGNKDNTFEAIPLTTSSKKKRAKKSKKKKKQESSSATASVATPPDAQPPPSSSDVQEEQLPTPPAKMADEESPLQSRKTSPSTSPSSSVYGGTSNPSRPPSESADGPFKKRSKPAVILRKVKKSLTSTITENVTMREGSSTGRPVAMVKGLISSLASSMSQGNVAMPTADVTFVTTMDPRTNGTPADDSEHNAVVEKPIVLSDVANQLSDETLVARTSLSSLATISDPIQLEHTLTKWLAHLEKFWDDDGGGSHDSVPTSFHLLSNAIQDGVRELLGACLHAEVFYGNHSNSDTTFDMPQSEHAEEKAFPDFPNKGLPLHEGLGYFINRYFHLLDTNQLRLKLSTCDIEIANSFWDHMITCMMQCINSDDEIMMLLSAGNHDNAVKLLSKNLEEDTVSPWLPLYVSRMVSSDPSGAVEVCVDHYPYLDIWEVARLYHVTPTNYPTAGKDSLSKSNESGYNSYCNYIQQLFQKEAFEWACFHDNVYLVLLCIECLLRNEVSLTNELCPANQLQPLEAHPSLPILDKLLNLSCHHISHSDRDHVIKLCDLYSYWIGYIQLCLSVRRLEDAFTKIIELGDSALLNQPLRWGQLPSNLQEWQVFLKCMFEVGPPPTSESAQSDSSITWESVLLQLIESHGPLQVTHLLDSIAVASDSSGMASVELGSFQCRLNRMLVSLATLQQQQEQLAHSMLGKVDTYLWNPRHNPLGPHAMLLVTKSYDIDGDHVIPQGEGSQHDVITLEDSECHWGIRVARSDTNCAICSLPLTSNLPSSLGLYTFVCGHSYHQQCLPEQACVKCYAVTVANSVK